MEKKSQGIIKYPKSRPFCKTQFFWHFFHVFLFFSSKQKRLRKKNDFLKKGEKKNWVLAKSSRLSRTAKKQKKMSKTVNFDHLDGIVTWCFVCKKSVFLKQLLDSQVFWTIWVSTVQCGFSEMCVFYGLKRPLSKGTLIKNVR